MTNSRFILRAISIVFAIFGSGNALASTCADLAYAQNRLTNAVIMRDIQSQNLDRDEAAAEVEYQRCEASEGPAGDTWYCRNERDRVVAEINMYRLYLDDDVITAQNDLALVQSELTEVCY